MWSGSYWNIVVSFSLETKRRIELDDNKLSFSTWEVFLLNNYYKWSFDDCSKWRDSKWTISFKIWFVLEGLLCNKTTNYLFPDGTVNFPTLG